MKPVHGIETSQDTTDSKSNSPTFKLMKPVHGIETEQRHSISGITSFFQINETRSRD